MVYADETDVRLQHGLHAEFVITEGVDVAIGATQFTMDTRAYGIISISRNNTPLVAGIVPLASGEFEFRTPKKILLGDAVIADDAFDITTEAEVPSLVVDNFIEGATDDIKSILEERFGEPLLTIWDTTTPVLIKRIATQMAGYEAERSMLRKGHKFDSKDMDTLNSELNRLTKKLKRLATGEDSVPGEDSIGGDPKASRTKSTGVFDLRQDVRNVEHQGLDHELGTDGLAVNDGRRGQHHHIHRAH